MQSRLKLKTLVVALTGAFLLSSTMSASATSWPWSKSKTATEDTATKGDTVPMQDNPLAKSNNATNNTGLKSDTVPTQNNSTEKLDAQTNIDKKNVETSTKKSVRFKDEPEEIRSPAQIKSDNIAEKGRINSEYNPYTAEALQDAYNKKTSQDLQREYNDPSTNYISSKGDAPIEDDIRTNILRQQMAHQMGIKSQLENEGHRPGGNQLDAKYQKADYNKMKDKFEEKYRSSLRKSLGDDPDFQKMDNTQQRKVLDTKTAAKMKEIDSRFKEEAPTLKEFKDEGKTQDDYKDAYDAYDVKKYGALEQEYEKENNALGGNQLDKPDTVKLKKVNSRTMGDDEASGFVQENPTTLKANASGKKLPAKRVRFTDDDPLETQEKPPETRTVKTFSPDEGDPFSAFSKSRDYYSADGQKSLVSNDDPKVSTAGEASSTDEAGSSLSSSNEAHVSTQAAQKANTQANSDSENAAESESTVSSLGDGNASTRFEKGLEDGE